MTQADERGTDRREVSYVEIDASRAGQRVDNFLMGQLRGVPRTHIYRILRRGEVRVNKGRVKPDYKLRAGDVVRVPPLRVASVSAQSTSPPPSRLTERLAGSVIYEDDRLLVINKPPGIPVHAGTGVDYGVIEVFRYLRPDCPDVSLAHRLDRATSGVLVLAKTPVAMRELHAAFKSGTCEKHYLALTRGRWASDKTVVQASLDTEHRERGERTVRVSDEGRTACSTFRVVQVFSFSSLVKIQISTGRTHQIRVHAAHQGHPVAGDDRYGDPEFNRQMKALGLKRLFLHAVSLSLPALGQHPPLDFDAPLADDLKGVLDHLPIKRGTSK